MLSFWGPLLFQGLVLFEGVDSSVSTTNVGFHHCLDAAQCLGHADGLHSVAASVLLIDFWIDILMKALIYYQKASIL